MPGFSSPIKERMLYSSCKNSVVEALEKVYSSITITFTIIIIIIEVYSITITDNTSIFVIIIIVLKVY